MAGIFRTTLNSVPLEIDLEKGSYSFFGLPAVTFWLNPSLYRMLAPLVKEAGPELARLLGSLFEPCEERVLLYPARDATSSLDADPAHTDRSHEYALVFRKRRPTLDIDGARALLQRLRDDGHDLRVHGSFAPWMQGDPVAGMPRPSDVDAHVTADAERFRALLQALVRLGFRLSLWGDPVNADVHPDTVRRHHYLRAERLQGDGRFVRLDLSPHAAE